MDSNLKFRLMRKTKRFRSAFTTEQVSYLENQFRKYPYISSEYRRQLALALNMEERAVKIWFQNRRMREKKETDKDVKSDTNTAEEFKHQLNNVCASSANDQLSFSVPRLPMNVDAKINAVKKITNKTKSQSSNDKRNKSEFKNVPPEYETHNVLAKSCLNNNFGRFSTGFDKKTRNDFSFKEDKKLLRTQCLKNTSKMTPKCTAPKNSYANRNSLSIVNKPSYIPLIQTMYTHPLEAPSVVWKSMNVVPVIASGPVPVHPLRQQEGGNPRSCNCECHNKHNNVSYGPPRSGNPYPQYILSVPYQNASSGM